MIAHIIPLSALGLKKQKWGLGWEESRLYRYNIRAEGTLPPSITVTARVKIIGYWICNVSLNGMNSK